MLTISNGLGVVLLTRIVDQVNNFLVVNQDQVAEKHTISIFLELWEANLITIATHKQISLICGQPALVDRDLI